MVYQLHALIAFLFLGYKKFYFLVCYLKNENILEQKFE